MTRSERLKRAMGIGWNGSLRGFAAELKGVRGGSYGSLRNYLAGDSEPPLDFLLAAAPVLGVSPEWLAHETGEPTGAHTATADAMTPEEQAENIGLRLERAVLDRLGIPTTGGSPLEPWVAPLLEVLRREYHIAHVVAVIDGGSPEAVRDDVGASRVEATAAKIAEAVAAPLDALGISPADHLGAHALDDYILSITTALNVISRRRPPLASKPPQTED